jgi:hypothetical protein
MSRQDLFETIPNEILEIILMKVCEIEFPFKLRAVSKRFLQCFEGAPQN